MSRASRSARSSRAWRSTRTNTRCSAASITPRRRRARHRASDTCRPAASSRAASSIRISAACSAKLKGPKGDAPPHVLLPRPIGNTGGNMPHGQNAGFLGKSFDPFVLNADPSDPNFQVPDLLPPDYLPPMRVDRPPSMRASWSTRRSALRDVARRAAARQQLPVRPTRMMSSQKAREAFDLHREPRATPPRNVRPQPLRPELPAGAAHDRARRAVRHGQHVRDGLQRDHVGHPRLDAVQPDQLLSRPVGPMFDMPTARCSKTCTSAGCCRTRWSLAMGEFGRTPKVNPAGGRDHWTNCWTILMGGGGIKGGQVIGASDEIGGYPRDRPDRAAGSSRRRSTRRSASTSRRRLSAPRTGPSPSSTTAMRRSMSCSSSSRGFAPRTPRTVLARRFAAAPIRGSLAAVARALLCDLRCA